MSTLESTATGTLPTGTWQLDAVHSQVGFAVKYMVGTFRGSFSPVAATLSVGPGRRRQPDRVGAGRERQGAGAEPGRAPALARLLRRRARTRAAASARPTSRVSGDHVVVDGDLTIKGVTRPVTLEGDVTEPITDPYGRERIGITLAGTIDRTEFGITWNNPLPSGKSALANEVSLAAELYLVKE